MKIGFLPFYVDYYEGICASFPAEKLANARRCADALAVYGEVCWDGELIQDRDQAAETGRSLCEQEVDCAVVFTSIAVFGGISFAALEELDVPILIWNAQQIQSVGPDYSTEEIVRNTVQIGTQALANTLMRHGRWFRVVTGYEQSARTAEELRRFFGAIKAVHAVRKARLLAIGAGFPMMTDIVIDEEALKRDLGTTVIHITAQELTRRYEETPATALDHARIEELSADEAQRSARLSHVLQSLVEEHHADAGTLNCHGEVCLQNPAIGITACYALGEQNSQGRPFACTGDLPTAIAMLIMKVLSGVALYTEVQVMDEARGAIVIANSGEGEEAIRRRNTESVVRGNASFTGCHGKGASFSYPLEPDPATLVSFTPSPCGARPYRLIVAEGHILDDVLPGAGGVAGYFMFSDEDFHGAYTRWMEAGAVHHAATSLGHWTRELKTIAELLNIDYVEV